MHVEATISRAGLIAAFLMLCAVPVSAQQRDRVPDAVLRRASAGSWYVRALTIHAPPDTLLGRASIYRDEFRVGETTIDPVDLARLERRTRTGYGAVAGGIIGAVVLGGAAYRFAGADDTGWYNVVVGTAAVAAFGGLIGMFAGNAISPGRVEWEPVWPDR